MTRPANQPLRSGGMLSAEMKLAGRMDSRFFALLEAVEATGSIHRAAAAAGLSHKGARLMLETASNHAHAPLLESAVGGAGGGGTRLTAAARELLAAWRSLQTDLDDFLRVQEARLATMPALAGLLRRMSMKTSARNQYAGTVTKVETGPVSTQVTVTLESGHEVVSGMTTAAAKRLKLKKGIEALALIKASDVVLVAELAGWKLSACNQLDGTVSRIEKGAVSSLVVLTLPGGATVTSSVTNEGAEALGLKVGAPATAVFKAYSVMIAVQG